MRDVQSDLDGYWCFSLLCFERGPLAGTEEMGKKIIIWKSSVDLPW